MVAVVLGSSFYYAMAMAMAMAIAIKWSLPLDLERGRLLWDDNRF